MKTLYFKLEDVSFDSDDDITAYLRFLLIKLTQVIIPLPVPKGYSDAELLEFFNPDTNNQQLVNIAHSLIMNVVTQELKMDNHLDYLQRFKINTLKFRIKSDLSDF